MFELDHPPGAGRQPTNSFELQAQDSLPSLVIRALEVLQDAHFEGNFPVQIEERGFGGRAYRNDGTSLQFTDALPGSIRDDDVMMREHWRKRGFINAEINSGISTLVTYSADRSAVTERVFIAGLLDTWPGIRVLRQREDGQFTDSDLTGEESSAIVRIAFLSQLIGYVSNRYADHSPYAATDAFVAEIEAASMLNGNRLDGGRLREMFDSVHLNATTIVAGMKRFSTIVGDHRQRIGNIDNPIYSGINYEAEQLVHRGEYFIRILASLGFTMDELTARAVPPQAIETAK